jgi:hypothetical protein
VSLAKRFRATGWPPSKDSEDYRWDVAYARSASATSRP